MFKKIFLSMLLLLFAAGSASAQGYGIGTPSKRRKWSSWPRPTSRPMARRGRCRNSRKPNGKFQWRDLYVFAYDLKGVMDGASERCFDRPESLQ